MPRFTHHGMARLQIATGDAGSTHREKLVVVRWLMAVLLTVVAGWEHGCVMEGHN